MFNRILVIGLGEVGSAWVSLLKEKGKAVFTHDPPKNIISLEKNVDVIHICVPYVNLEQFLNVIAETERNFEFKVLIIESTIQPFELSKCELDFKKHLYLHSPMRGTHPTMLAGLKKYLKFVAPLNWSQFDDCKTFATEYYNTLNLNHYVLHCSDESSLGKIFATTWYAMQIAYVNMIKKYCDFYNLKFEQVYTFPNQTDEIGRFYEKNDIRSTSDDLIPRPTFTPGKIGGHCLMPNLKLLTNTKHPILGLWKLIEAIDLMSTGVDE